MKQDLKQWVDLLRQEQLLIRALEYLWKVDVISGGALSSARRASDSGAGILLARLRELDQTAEGRERLNKLRNQVRQWRAAKKRSLEGGVTRKIFLSREADEILRGLAGSAGPGFNISGLIDYLLKKESAIYQDERSLLDNEREQLKVKAAKQSEEIQRKRAGLLKRAEKLDVREEEIEKWRKLRALARKAARDTAIGPEQEIAVRIETLEDGNRDLEVSATLGSRKLQRKVRDSVSEFLSELLELIEE
ncbi:MAG: hypothetical protein RI567_13320 [Marinobacter sp.]|nr:hypothetical protein [Marinobacter sp.]